MTIKKEGVCPNCGQWNYKLPTYERQKVLDEYGENIMLQFQL